MFVLSKKDIYHRWKQNQLDICDCDVISPVVNLNPGYITLINIHSKSEDSQSTPNTYG